MILIHCSRPSWNQKCLHNQSKWIKCMQLTTQIFLVLHLTLWRGMYEKIIPMYVWHCSWELEENSAKASTLMGSKWSGTKRTDLPHRGAWAQDKSQTETLPELCLLRDIPEPMWGLNPIWAGQGSPGCSTKEDVLQALSRAEHIQRFQMSLASLEKLKFKNRAHHAALLHFLNPALSLVMTLGDGKMNKLLSWKGSGGHTHEWANLSFTKSECIY